MNRIWVIVIVMFPVISMLAFCYWGFIQPRPAYQLPLTNSVIVQSNSIPDTNSSR